MARAQRAQGTSTENPGETPPTADHAVNSTRRPVNRVRAHVNLSSSQESGNNDGRTPAQPNTATSASDPLTESHGPSPFNQSHHVSSRTSFPDGLSSVIHLIRRPTTRPSHLRMRPSTAGNTGSADFPIPFPSCLKCFFLFFFFCVHLLFSPNRQSHEQACSQENYGQNQNRPKRPHAIPTSLVRAPSLLFQLPNSCLSHDTVEC